MPRVAPTLIEFVTADDGEYLKWAEAVFRIFDRQDWLRVNRARARIKVLVDKVGIDAVREHGRGGARGRLGRRARLLDRGPRVPLRRAGRRPRACRTPTARPTATAPRSSASARPTSSRSASEGFSTVQVKVTRGDLTPGAVPRPRADHARVLRRPRPHHRAPELPAALGARRGGLRRLAAARRARARRRRRGPGQRRRLLPRHRLLQARHHELDGAQPGRPGADRVDGDHRPADAPDPHQDVRLPERLQPAPHRQHRVLRRVDQGRRAHDPRLRGAHRRQLRGRRHRLRRPPEGPAGRQARARGRRALDPPLRGRARGRARSSTPSSRASGPRPSRTACATSRCRSSSAWRRWSTSSTGRKNVPFQVVRGEGECAV